jgi:hypothetical protein
MDLEAMAGDRASAGNSETPCDDMAFASGLSS